MVGPGYRARRRTAAERQGLPGSEPERAAPAGYDVVDGLRVGGNSRMNGDVSSPQVHTVPTRLIIRGSGELPTG